MNLLPFSCRIFSLNSKEIPILALTSFAMSGDEQRILEAGCDGYIFKPIDTGEFMKKIEEYLS